MKVSFTGVSKRQEFFSQNTGYGKLFKKLYDNISKTEYEPVLNDRSAPIAICCENPSWLYKEGNQYTIGYTTHESTEMMQEWIDNLDTVDEIWTPSEFIADIIRKYTNKQVLNVPIFVDDTFKPVRRRKDTPFFFLHVGEPAVRKGGSLVLECFAEIFKDNPNVFMVFKSFGNTPNLIGSNLYSNVIVIGSDYSEEEMNSLYAKMHCLVYPTMGEGGGFIPLEAMFTGLPTISTTQWSDYKKFIKLPIKSGFVDVPNDIIKNTPLRGQFILPDKESVKEQMLEVYENYKKYEEIYSNQVEELRKEHSWERVVNKIVVPRLREIKGNNGN